MEVIFVRHGESSANAEGRLQGQRDYPLTRRGRTQARIVADWLRERGLEWQVAYCSPLARAKQTAEIVSDGRGVSLTELDDLMEFNAGRLQGLLYTQVRDRYPEFFARTLDEHADYGRWAGESYAEVQSRVDRVSLRLQAAQRAQAERVLVVGHGGFGGQLIKSLVCHRVPRVLNLKLDNCTVLLVRLSEGATGHVGHLVWQLPVELMK